MKLYRVNGALPYFVSKQDEAKRDARNLRCSWEAVEVPTSDGREALAEFLNGMGGPASITISGENIDPPAPVTPPTPQERELLTDGYTERSVALDDQFDALPLARQLDFAARAMENAREKL